MRNTILSVLSLIAFGFSTSCTSAPDDFKPEAIIAIERASLDRWGKGDPQGYLESYAPEVTYSISRKARQRTGRHAQVPATFHREDQCRPLRHA